MTLINTKLLDDYLKRVPKTLRLHPYNLYQINDGKEPQGDF